MAHGFTAVKEMFLDDYAAAFAAAGLATLVYDHYGFGASGGEPRQYPAACIQLDGYRDAIGWLRGQPGVTRERIGTSNSGGYVIVLAAENLPIRCAVAQVPGLGEHRGTGSLRQRVPTLFIDAEFEEYNQNDPELQGIGAYEVVRQNAVSARHTFPCTHYRVYDEYLEPAREVALDWFNTYL